MAELKWYTFRQNNSGGRFSDPAMVIAIEAHNEAAAKFKAPLCGVDESAPYCPCCGERWYLGRCEEHDAKPSLGDVVGTEWERFYAPLKNGVPRILYVHADGSKEAWA